MRKRFHTLTLILLLIMSLLGAAAPVQGDARLVDILRSQPCSGGWEIQASYPPYARCYGLNRSVVTTTLIPVPRAYKSSPHYPLVGLVTALGVDWDPASFAFSQTQTHLYRPEDDWFVNYRVEVKISSFTEQKDFFNPPTETNRFYSLQDRLAQVDWGYASTYTRRCPNFSLEGVLEYQGGWNGCRSLDTIEKHLATPHTMKDTAFYEMGGARPDWFWLGSQVSSKNGSAQKDGEPAFGVQVTTRWTVWARSTWDHYYDWDCHPEMIVDPRTGRPVLDPLTGQPVTQQICDWVDRGPGGGLIYLGPATLNYVIVPGAGVQPLYPVPVFQSQPLLTTP